MRGAQQVTVQEVFAGSRVKYCTFNMDLHGFICNWLSVSSKWCTCHLVQRVEGVLVGRLYRGGCFRLRVCWVKVGMAALCGMGATSCGLKLGTSQRADLCGQRGVQSGSIMLCFLRAIQWGEGVVVIGKTDAVTSRGVALWGLGRAISAGVLVVVREKMPISWFRAA